MNLSAESLTNNVHQRQPHKNWFQREYVESQSGFPYGTVWDCEFYGARELAVH